VPVRGNADTRLARVQSGELEAVVLGYAGMARIGRLDAVTQVFDPAEMMPAPGQGALAVECKADRDDLISMLACVDDPASRAATAAERSLLAGLEVGCLAPVGSYAVGTSVLHLQAMVASADGKTALRGNARGSAVNAENLGRELAASLLHRGAGDLTAANDMKVIGVGRRPGSRAAADDLAEASTGER
jgi:hydroxymethylbilane synthase